MGAVSPGQPKGDASTRLPPVHHQCTSFPHPQPGQYEVMEHVVIGLDDEVSDRGIDWVIRRATVMAVQLRLVMALDVDGSDPAATTDVLAATARRVQLGAPGTLVETVVTHRPLLHELIEQSGSAELLVVGSHPDPGIREVRSASFPVSLGARSQCPLVIVPDDWTPLGGPVVVGVDGEPSTLEAATFAATEAASAGRGLRIVHTWEAWKALDRRTDRAFHAGAIMDVAHSIRTEFPSVPLSGELAEAVAHDGVISNSRDAHLIVLGTHRLGRETGLVLGAIHQEVMIRGRIPLAVVPLTQVGTPVATVAGLAADGD